MKSIIKRLIPKPVKRTIRRCQDAVSLMSGQRDKLTPPRRMIKSIGGGDFKEIGERFLNFFINYCDLKPCEKVLDVGSGSGRMAMPLAKYLSDGGSYEGFDIISEQIEWCQKNITPVYPNVCFQLADIYNKMYHPLGKFKASDYVFPYADESFDFVFLTSVFTHLLPPEMERYLSEIARVLKKNGRCFITFFLLNEESLNLVDAKKSSRDFKFDFGNYRIENQSVPEDAVGYDETFIKNLFQKYNLEIKLPIRYGSWCDRPNPFDYQDIVIASKSII